MVECLKIGRDWRTFYLWKNESSQGKVYLCMAFSWVHLRVWTTWVRQYSKREPQSFGLKCESLGLWNQLEIKEGNPAKDFQQGDPSSPQKSLFILLSNPWLNTELHMCQADTNAPRRKGQMESWEDRAEISAVECEGEIEVDFFF